MRCKVHNHLTNGPELADVTLNGTTLDVQLVDRDLHFQCEPMFINEFSEDNIRLMLMFVTDNAIEALPLGLFRILDANIEYTQNYFVTRYDESKITPELKQLFKEVLSCT